MQVEASQDGVVVTAKAPGFFRLPKALALLGIGVLFSSVALFVLYAVFLMIKREPGFGSILAAIIPLLLALLLFWLGRLGFRWAFAAALGTTKLSFQPGLLVVERSGLWRSRSEVRASDRPSMMVTDEFKLILELIVSTADHRTVLVVNGRTGDELEWLASLIYKHVLGNEGTDEELKDEET